MPVLFLARGNWVPRDAPLAQRQCACAACGLRCPRRAAGSREGVNAPQTPFAQPHPPSSRALPPSQVTGEALGPLGV